MLPSDHPGPPSQPPIQSSRDFRFWQLFSRVCFTYALFVLRSCEMWNDTCSTSDGNNQQPAFTARGMIHIPLPPYETWRSSCSKTKERHQAASSITSSSRKVQCTDRPSSISTPRFDSIDTMFLNRDSWSIKDNVRLLYKLRTGSVSLLYEKQD